MAWHLFGAKPLPDPMLLDYELDHWEQNPVKFNQSDEYTSFKKMDLELSSAKCLTFI